MDLEAELQEARTLSARGHFQEAAERCRRILKANPDRSDVRCQYGIILAQTGKVDGALQQVRQAVRSAPGNVHFQMLLADILERAGRQDEAVKAYEAVLLIQPGSIEARGTMANLLQSMGRLAEAEAAYRQILATAPRTVPALINLGNVLHESGRYSDAVICFREAIQYAPDLAEAYSNLGNSLGAMHVYEEAIAALEQAVRMRPDFAEAFNNLGNAYFSLGKLDMAKRAYDRAVELNPAYAEAWHNLACIFRQRRDYGQAMSCCERALNLRPELTDALLTKGLIQGDQALLSEAEKTFRQVLVLAPNDRDALGNLCGIFQDLGRVQEAIDYSRRGLASGFDSRLYQGMLLSMHYLKAEDPEALFKEHVRWGGMLQQAPMKNHVGAGSGAPQKKLRIGYVSPDFRRHPVATFIEPVLAGHDRHFVEVVCFSNVGAPDDITGKFEKIADVWRNIHGRSTKYVADLVRKDEIDILVDLAGHTADNLLDVFALKPAPIQVTYLGYPDTTGLETVDYRLTDAWADPEGMTEQYHTESLVRLPHSFLCYTPSGESPPIEGLPLSSNGYVTFGSFNNLAKVSDEAVELWAGVLHAVENSRLFVKSKQLADAQARDRLLRKFSEKGVDPHRIELAAWVKDKGGHLAAYGKVDIALDTFPYHGTTTTCEALWMGVPVVSLAGQTHVSRVGVSILNNVGLPELVAHSADDYVRRAVTLVQDKENLAVLRKELREQMMRSPLCDAGSFVKNMESAYRQMWVEYCQGVRQQS